MRYALWLTVPFLALTTSSAAATPVKQYVLSHPKREHCRTSYARKTETVKRHEHGHVLKVRETLCVLKALPRPVTPKPMTPSTPLAPGDVPPSPVTPATPVSQTTTTLSVSAPFGCKRYPEPLPTGTSCAAYEINATAVGTSGEALGPVWLFFSGTKANGEHEASNPEELRGKAITVEVWASATESEVTGNSVVALGALASWSVSASYAGSVGEPASQSALQVIAP